MTKIKISQRLITKLNKIYKQKIMFLSHLENFKKLLVSNIMHVENSLRMVTSKLLLLHPDKLSIINKAFITSSILILMAKHLFLTHHNLNLISSIVELALKNKKMIYKDKLIEQNNCTLTIKLLQTLVLELIGKEKVCNTYWNNQCEVISRNLSFFTETDFVDSHLNSSISSSHQMEVKYPSLIKKTTNPHQRNSLTTSFQSFISTHVEKWDNEDIHTQKSNPVFKCRKIKLYPTLQQKTLLQSWFNNARYAYNKTLELFKQNNRLSAYDLRDIVVTKTRYLCNNCNKYTGKTKKCKYCDSNDIDMVHNNIMPEHHFETPKHIRLASSKSLISGYKSACTNIRNGNITKFNLKFKSKKKLKSDSIELDRNCIKLKDKTFIFYGNEISFCKNNKKRKKTKKSIPDIIEHDIKINYNKVHNEYYVIIPIKVKLNPYNLDEKKVFSNDPGVKTLMTGYDGLTGDKYEFKNRREDLKKIKNKIRILQGLRKKQKKINKEYKKLNNIIKDNQNKISEYITNKYDLIIIGKFDSQKCTKKNKNKYNNILINFQKHYQLRERIKWDGIKKGKKVLIVPEYYTTKTCGICGTLNNEITLNDREYSCIIAGCEYKRVERDYHSARNILIRTLVKE